MGHRQATIGTLYPYPRKCYLEKERTTLKKSDGALLKNLNKENLLTQKILLLLNNLIQTQNLKVMLLVLVGAEHLKHNNALLFLLHFLFNMNIETLQLFLFRDHISTRR